MKPATRATRRKSPPDRRKRGKGGPDDVGRTPLHKRGCEADVFREMCRLSNTPRSLAAFLLFESGEWEQLLEIEFDPSFMEGQFSLRRRTLFQIQMDYQVVCFNKKRTDLPLNVDRKAVALGKWLAAEESCKRVNDLFRLRWEGTTCSNPTVEHVISRARRKVSKILRGFDASFVRSHAHFGPGADLATEKFKTSWYDKFCTPGNVTPWSRAFIIDLLSAEDFDTREFLVEQAQPVTTSRLSFVPKNAKTERSICVEPRWNIFAQLGVGELMQARLRTGAGIDIRDQSRNQRLASIAWEERLATLDLSAASDSVATNLVIDMLADADPMWLEAILRLRCPYTSYEENRYRLEKVSSMGNGYTFPLETLLFYALASAACECVDVSPIRTNDYCSVYGDDIIVPLEAYSLLVEVLQYVGFTPNSEKSYSTGVFHESCGKDFFRGRDIRPVFIKNAVVSTEQAYTFVNQLASLAARFAGSPGTALRSVWALRGLVIRRIPKDLRFLGPPEAGDSVIHATFDSASPTLRRDAGDRDGDRQWSGYWVTGLITVVEKHHGSNWSAHLLSKLSGITDMGNFVVRRDSSYRRKGNVYVLTYTDVLLL